MPNEIRGSCAGGAIRYEVQSDTIAMLKLPSPHLPAQHRLGICGSRGLADETSVGPRGAALLASAMQAGPWSAGSVPPAEAR